MRRSDSDLRTNETPERPSGGWVVRQAGIAALGLGGAAMLAFFSLFMLVSLVWFGDRMDVVGQLLLVGSLTAYVIGGGICFRVGGRAAVRTTRALRHRSR